MTTIRHFCYLKEKIDRSVAAVTQENASTFQASCHTLSRCFQVYEQCDLVRGCGWTKC